MTVKSTALGVAAEVCEATTMEAASRLQDTEDGAEKDPFMEEEGELEEMKQFWRTARLSNNSLQYRLLVYSITCLCV